MPTTLATVAWATRLLHALAARSLRTLHHARVRITLYALRFTLTQAHSHSHSHSHCQCHCACVCVRVCVCVFARVSLCLCACVSVSVYARVCLCLCLCLWHCRSWTRARPPIRTQREQCDLVVIDAELDSSFWHYQQLHHFHANRRSRPVPGYHLDRGHQLRCDGIGSFHAVLVQDSGKQLTRRGAFLKREFRRYEELRRRYLTQHHQYPKSLTWRVDCIAEEPCATCLASPTLCTSCIPNTFLNSTNCIGPLIHNNIHTFAHLR